MATITLEGVEKRFTDDTAAVRGVSLEIRDGELFVLLGPSGCGKSTLLNMIVGLEDPTAGTIAVDGRAVNGVEPGKRNMAMVFQSYAIYPHMSVRENLAFPLDIAGVPEEEQARRVAEAAEILELDELLDRRPATLSGGQRQRVAMGRAIVRDPVAFLLDEPLSNLDARLRGQMRTEIARLHRRLGTTTVYVTHDQTEALTLADRMAVLSRGEIQQVGTPREVYARPANRFVASFLGAPPMTFLPAERDGDELVCALGRMPAPAGASEVVVGVRPEHVHEAESRRAGPATASTPHDGPAQDAVTADASPAKEPAGAASPRLHLQGRVELVEWLGAETYAWVETLGGGEANGPRREAPDGRPAEPSHMGPGQRLVARLAPDSAVGAGDVVDLEVDVARLHIFDAATGARVGGT